MSAKREFSGIGQGTEYLEKILSGDDKPSLQLRQEMVIKASEP